MKIAGIVLLVLGLVGTAFFGIRAFNNSETFEIFGLDIATSHANWTPLIISVIVLVVGIVLTSMRRKAV